MFPDQRTDVGHRSRRTRVECGCPNVHPFADADRGQILRRDVDLGPHLAQIRNRQDGSVFFHRLTETQMLLDHDAIERRPELQPIQRAACASAQPQCAELLLRVGDGHFGFMHLLAGLQEILLSRDSLLPETLFPFVSHFRQCQAPLGGLKFASLFRRTNACDGREHCTLADGLPDGHTNAVDDACEARNNVRCSVFVQLDFARELQD